MAEISFFKYYILAKIFSKQVRDAVYKVLKAGKVKTKAGF